MVYKNNNYITKLKINQVVKLSQKQLFALSYTYNRKVIDYVSNRIKRKTPQYHQK